LARRVPPLQHARTELKERANAIFKLGRYEQALGLYQKAIRLAEGEPDIFDNAH